jgi:hypothetical protein
VRDALLFVEKIEQRRAQSLNLARYLARMSQEQRDQQRREATKEQLTQDLIRKYGPPPENKPKAHKTKAKAHKKKRSTV